MLDKDGLRALIEQGIDTSEIEITGDGYHYDLTIVSDEFKEKRTLNRQQMVYQLLNAEITAGNLHALTIKTLTQDEKKEKENG